MRAQERRGSLMLPCDVRVQLGAGDAWPAVWLNDRGQLPSLDEQERALHGQSESLGDLRSRENNVGGDGFKITAMAHGRP